MLSKFNPAAREKLLPGRKSIPLIFLGEKTDSGTKTEFHGNLRDCNCSLPQSHSLLCAGSGSQADPLSHFSRLRRQKNIHFFRLGSFFLSLCTEMAIQTLKRAGLHSWDREEGQDHNILQSGLFCPGACSLCVWFQPPEITFWAPPLSCHAVMCQQVGWNTLVYKEGYSKWPWESLL